MKKRILITGTLASEAQQMLQQQGYELEIVGSRDLIKEHDLKVALRGKHAYILGGDEIATSNVIQATDVLRVIAFIGTGYASFIDAAAAAHKGVAVTNTPGANRQAVAEMTVSMMLAAWRQLVFLDSEIRCGRWTAPMVRDIKGKTLGIVGFGAIGSRVAEIAGKGLDMHVVYYSRTKRPDIEKLTGATMLQLDALLQSSDVVTLHVPYDPARPSTAGMIGARELELMRHNAVLINTSRAQVVDGDALFDALNAGKLGAAAFDGYYTEPEAPTPANDKHRLLSLPCSRFLVTPHTAWKTAESDANTSAMAAQSVVDVLEGKHCSYVVNGV